MTLPMDTAIPVPVHFDGHNINIISENLPTATVQPKSTGSPNKDRQSLYKTELCREWSTSGWCYYGKRCSFAHGLNELRPVFRSKKWRTKRCRNWQSTGYCPYEHRCQFLHDQTPPRQAYDDEESDGASPGAKPQQQQQQAGEKQQQPPQKQQQQQSTLLPSDSSKGQTSNDVMKKIGGGGGGGGHAGGPTKVTVVKDKNISKVVHPTTTATKIAPTTTAGDGGNQLYFHFDVRVPEEDIEPATDDSENYAGGEQQQQQRLRNMANPLLVVKGEDVLNDIGNLEGVTSSTTTMAKTTTTATSSLPSTAATVGGVGATTTSSNTATNSVLSGNSSATSSTALSYSLLAKQSGMKGRRRGRRSMGAMMMTARTAQQQQQQPVVTQISSGSPSTSPRLDSVAPRKRKMMMNGSTPLLVRTHSNGSSGSSEASPPPSFARPTFAYGGVHSPLELSQAHQIMANQATANQLAAHLASVQAFGNAGGTMTNLAGGQTVATGATTGGGGGATGVPPMTTTNLLQHQQFIAALQRMSSNGSMGGVSTTGVEGGVVGGGGGTSPPPSVPIDWTGLAGGLPSIPMSNQGDTNSALMNAMYTMGGPSLTELYYQARLNQMPTAELEQLCMGLYPTTAPVPFGSSPMTPGGGLGGLAGASGVGNGMGTTTLSGLKNGGGVRSGGANGGVFDTSPSGSVEPPGFDSAFYPTPSPPPSSFGGLDSVSNLNGVRFVPNDPSGAQFGLAYAAATATTGPGGAGGHTPLAAQFLLPHCSTPVPMGSPPPPMTPTGFYGGFPHFFGGPAVAGAPTPTPATTTTPALNTGLAGATVTGTNPMTVNISGTGGSSPNGIAFVSGNPGFARSVVPLDGAGRT